MAVLAAGAPGPPPGPPSAPLSAPGTLPASSVAQPSVDQLNMQMAQLNLNDPAQASANLAAMMWQMTQQNPAMMNNMMGLAPPWGAPPGAPMMPPMPGIDTPPPLNVRVDGLKFEYQLTEDDVRKVFSRYGGVRTVLVDREGTSATVLFDSAAQAVTAQRDLDGKQLAGMSGAFLRVDLAPPPFDPTAALAAQMSQMPGFPPSQMPGFPPSQMPGFPMPQMQGYGMPPGPPGRPKKYTCKLEVGIENESDFRVGSRVIQVARQIWQDPLFQEHGGKTRLRGKGVGGPHEAEEPLALCISCCDQGSFDKAVGYAEQQLQKIQVDYRAYCEQKGMPCPDLAVKISKKGSHSVSPGGSESWGPPMMPGSPSGGVEIKPDPPRGERPPGAPSEAEIEGLIEERNEARKAANFKRSDEIRDWLKACGVVLMDEKGAKGNFRGNQVTKWRYWRP